MPSTRIQGIPLAQIDLKIQQAIRRMAQANTNSTGASMLLQLPIEAKLSITNELLQMLHNCILFVPQLSEDPYEHIQNIAHVCMSIMGRQHPSMDIVGLQVFPITLTGNAIMWYFKLSQDVITSWVELQRACLARFYIRSNSFKMRGRYH